MNKRLLGAMMFASIALASCSGGGKVTFYNKEFTYKYDVCYGIDNIESTSGKSKGSVIQENFDNNIDWDKTGFTSLLGVTPFESHATYADMCTSMGTMAKATFNKLYGSDFSVSIGTFSNKKGSITYMGEKKVCDVKGYPEDTEEATTVRLYEQGTEEKIAEVTMASYTGASCVNGVWDCVEVTYGILVNYVACQVTFKNAVAWAGENVTTLGWNVYGKISN